MPKDLPKKDLSKDYYYLLTNYQEFLHNHTILNGDYSLVNDNRTIIDLDPVMKLYPNIRKEREEEERRAKEKEQRKRERAMREMQKQGIKGAPRSVKAFTESTNTADKRIDAVRYKAMKKRERLTQSMRMVTGGKKKKFMKGGNIANVRQKYLWSFAPIDAHHDFPAYKYIESYKKQEINGTPQHAWKNNSVERHLYHDVLKEIDSIDNNYLENYYTIIPIHKNSPFLQSNIKDILYLDPAPSKDLTLYDFAYNLKIIDPSKAQIHTIQGSIFDKNALDDHPKSFKSILENLNFPPDIKCLSDGYPQSNNNESKSDLIQGLKASTKAYRNEIFPAEIIFDPMKNNTEGAVNFLNNVVYPPNGDFTFLNIVQCISSIISGRCDYTWCQDSEQDSQTAAINSLKEIKNYCNDNDGYLDYGNPLPLDFSLSSVPFSLLTRQLFNSVYVLTEVHYLLTNPPLLKPTDTRPRVVTGLLFTKSFLNSVGQDISKLILDFSNPATITQKDKDYRFAIVTQYPGNLFYKEVVINFNDADILNNIQNTLRDTKNYLCLLFENYVNSPFAIDPIKKYIAKLESNQNGGVTLLINELTGSLNGKNSKTFKHLNIDKSLDLKYNVFNVMVHYIIIYCWRAINTNDNNNPFPNTEPDDLKKPSPHTYDIFIPMLDKSPSATSNFFNEDNYIDYIKFILADFKKAGDAGKVWFNWITYSCPNLAVFGETYLETNEYLCALHGILKNSYVMASAKDSFDNIEPDYNDRKLVIFSPLKDIKNLDDYKKFLKKKLKVFITNDVALEGIVNSLLSVDDLGIFVHMFLKTFIKDNFEYDNVTSQIRYNKEGNSVMFNIFYSFFDNLVSIGINIKSLIANPVGNHDKVNSEIKTFQNKSNAIQQKINKICKAFSKFNDMQEFKSLIYENLAVFGELIYGRRYLNQARVSKGEATNIFSKPAAGNYKTVESVFNIIMKEKAFGLPNGLVVDQLWRGGKEGFPEIPALYSVQPQNCAFLQYNKIRTTYHEFYPTFDRLRRKKFIREFDFYRKNIIQILIEYSNDFLENLKLFEILLTEINNIDGLMKLFYGKFFHFIMAFIQFKSYGKKLKRHFESGNLVNIGSFISGSPMSDNASTDALNVVILNHLQFSQLELNKTPQEEAEYVLHNIISQYNNLKERFINIFDEFDAIMTNPNSAISYLLRMINKKIFDMEDDNQVKQYFKSYNLGITTEVKDLDNVIGTVVAPNVGTKSPFIDLFNSFYTITSRQLRLNCGIDSPDSCYELYKHSIIMLFIYYYDLTNEDVHYISYERCLKLLDDLYFYDIDVLYNKFVLTGLLDGTKTEGVVWVEVTDKGWTPQMLRKCIDFKTFTHLFCKLEKMPSLNPLFFPNIIQHANKLENSKEFREEVFYITKEIWDEAYSTVQSVTTAADQIQNLISPWWKTETMNRTINPEKKLKQSGPPQKMDYYEWKIFCELNTRRVSLAFLVTMKTTLTAHNDYKYTDMSLEKGKELYETYSAEWDTEMKEMREREMDTDFVPDPFGRGGNGKILKKDKLKKKQIKKNKDTDNENIKKQKDKEKIKKDKEKKNIKKDKEKEKLKKLKEKEKLKKLKENEKLKKLKEKEKLKEKLKKLKEKETKIDKIKKDKEEQKNISKKTKTPKKNLSKKKIKLINIRI